MMANETHIREVTKKVRLIDANAFLREFCEGCSAQEQECFPYYYPVCGAIQLLTEQTTVDAVEVVHGQWIEVNQRKDPEGWIECDYKCSICEEICWEGGNYCPNCCAKMDGGNEDG